MVKLKTLNNLWPDASAVDSYGRCCLIGIDLKGYNLYFCLSQVVMFFCNYKDHPEAKINPSLLWEYDTLNVDYATMRNVVVQRVIERGWPQDWYAMLNLYGIEGVKNAIVELPYLNDKDLNFVSLEFGLPLTDFKCYTRKQLIQVHWNS